MQGVDKPLVVVFGATGQQGTSVAHALCDAKFPLRLVCRDRESNNVASLKRLGAEVVEADLNRPETLDQVFKGASYCFLVTNFWDADCLSSNLEYVHAKNCIDAAKAARLKHVVFSMSEDTNKTTANKIEVPHFVGKGKAAEYLAQSGLSYTLLKLPFYFENFVSDFKPQKRENGKVVIDIPLGKKDRLPMMDVGDLGAIVVKIFQNPSNFNGKTYFLATESMTLEDLRSAFAAVMKQPIEIPELELEQWSKSTPIKHADKLISEWRYIREFPNIAQRADLAETKQLVSTPKSFSSWLSENVAKLV